MHVLFALITLLTTTLIGCTSIQSKQSDSVVEPGAGRLATYLERTVPFGFSGAVLIAIDGNLLLHEGYGFANREAGKRMTAGTVFDIGSITKQFTAAAILKLEENGSLRTTDPISRFFSDVPADKQEITLHHLLTHSAGLTSDLGGDYDVMPRDHLVKLALASELQWAPGTKYDYSNLGYSLLGAIVEIASGQPYEQYVHEQLLLPAGLEKTGYVLPTWSATNLAVGYRAGRRWGTPLEHDWAKDGPWWNLRANGGMLSTLGDLYKWQLALERGTVLSEASRAKRFTPHVPENESGSSHYGYGWAIFTTSRDTTLIAHDGSNGYFRMDFLNYVDENVLIIVATNRSDGPVGQVQNNIIDAVFSGNGPNLPPSASAALTQQAETYTGTYRLASGAAFEVYVDDGMLLMDAVGEEAAALLAGLDENDHSRFSDLGDIGVSAVSQALDARTSLLEATAHDPQTILKILERLVRTGTEALGRFEGVEGLGTVPQWWAGQEEPSTFIRLRFVNGARVYRLEWQEGRIRAIGGSAIPNPARTTLVPQSEAKFIGYNLGIERHIPICFELDSTGGAAVVYLGSEGRVVPAVRAHASADPHARTRVQLGHFRERDVLNRRALPWAP